MVDLDIGGGVVLGRFVQFGELVDSAEFLLDVADAVVLNWLLVVLLGYFWLTGVGVQ
jgi:hypothetical protein